MALSLALPGDTLLYLLLPLYAATFGVTLPEAGLLLAANRLVRIAGYGWVGRFYAAHGPRKACLLATAGAIISTFMYAVTSGLWPLLVARLIWGLSFAAMNIANQALPTSVIVGAPQRMGRARAITAAGPTVSLLAGAVLANVYGPRIVFLVLTVVAFIAPIFAARISTQREPVNLIGPRFEKPGPISIWSFSVGFTIDGLLIFGLGLLAAVSFPTGAVLAAGVAMSLRYASEMIFAPIGGRIGHHFGALRTLVTMSLLTAGALLLLAGSGVLAVDRRCHRDHSQSYCGASCRAGGRSSLPRRGPGSGARTSGDVARYRCRDRASHCGSDLSDPATARDLRIRGSDTRRGECVAPATGDARRAGLMRPQSAYVADVVSLRPTAPVAIIAMNRICVGVSD